MAQILNLTRDDPVIHLKAYGGLKIQGLERNQVTCEIDLPELVTIVEENGQVYITVNTSCDITVPLRSSMKIERGMGSVEITSIHNKIEIEKVLGNLVLNDISEVVVEKVGGNFAVRQATGGIIIEKVGGNLVADAIGSLQCEKIGGNCKAKNVLGDFSLEKIGGGLKVQSISGKLGVHKVGGSVLAKDVRLEGDLHAGGNISLKNFQIGNGNIGLYAGGDIRMELGDVFSGAVFELRSGAEAIEIHLNDDDLSINDGVYTYQVGDGTEKIDAAAGGMISIKTLSDPDEDILEDLSDHFSYEESPLSEMIRERIDSATRLANAKVKAAEIRLDQIRDRVEKHRGFHVDVDFEDSFGQKRPPSPRQPVPPESRPAGKKGATDEERLMILKMLQDQKITVDEAETLFQALEDRGK